MTGGRKAIGAQNGNEKTEHSPIPQPEVLPTQSAGLPDATTALVAIPASGFFVVTLPDQRKRSNILTIWQEKTVRKITYADGSEGRMIYITTTFFKQLSADLYGYRKKHSDFPDEPTTDQFFDEKQFEAYRELGFQAAWAMMKDEEVVADSVVHGIMQGGR